MGAPPEAYTAKKLPVKIDGVIKLDSELALKLSEYGSNIKTLFYLDKLLIGANGFLGMIEDNPASYNYKHHNPARFSKVRLKGPDGKKYIVLKDGGLNTLGDTNAEYADVQTFFANRIQINTDMKASYYDDVTAYGFRYKKVGASSWLTQSYSNTFLQNTSRTELILVTTDYIKDDQVILQPFITNSEGTYYFSDFTITVLAPVYGRGANYRTSSCGTGSNVIVYMRDDQYNDLSTVTTSATLTGIYVYSDFNLTTPVGAGYYAGLNASAIDRVYETGSDGQVIAYSTCVTPPTVRIQLTMGESSGFIQVFASISPTYGSAIIITGRCAPFDEFGNEILGGSNFTLNISSGSSGGNVLTFTSVDPSYTYKLTNISISPSDPDLTYSVTDYNP